MANFICQVHICCSGISTNNENHIDLEAKMSTALRVPYLANLKFQNNFKINDLLINDDAVESYDMESKST